jgi:hypothetical protein
MNDILDTPNFAPLNEPTPPNGTNWLLILELAIFSALAVLLFSYCADGRVQPSLQDELHGRWERTNDPTRRYLFGEGYATGWVYNFSTAIDAKWYQVERVSGRDMTLKEINTGKIFVWGFSEVVGDSVVVLTDKTGDLDFSFEIKRTK